MKEAVGEGVATVEPVLFKGPSVSGQRKRRTQQRLKH